jgi:hypothetical protein
MIGESNFIYYYPISRIDRWDSFLLEVDRKEKVIKKLAIDSTEPLVR